MRKLKTIPPLANIFSYQLAWFSIVLFAAAGKSEIAVATSLLLTILHLLVLEDPRRELKLITTVALIGSAIDSVIMYLGAFSFPHGATFLGLSLWPYPLWMSALWLSFATTLNHSLSWLTGRNYLAATLGAVGGPLCYIAGEKLGAITIEQPILYSLTLLTLGWAFAMTAISFYCRELEREREASA